MDTNTVEILNQLLYMHSRSLPMYLESARPHRRPGDEQAAEALDQIVADQQLMVERIAECIEDAGGTVDEGEFPMQFTDLHDLSIDYLIQLVMERQRAETEQIELLSAQLDGHHQAKAVAQEALGAAKAHLQSLEECLESTPS